MLEFTWDDVYIGRGGGGVEAFCNVCRAVKAGVLRGLRMAIGGVSSEEEESTLRRAGRDDEDDDEVD